MSGSSLDIFDTMIAIMEHTKAKIIRDKYNNEKQINFKIIDFPEWRFAVCNYFDNMPNLPKSARCKAGLFYCKGVSG